MSAVPLRIGGVPSRPLDRREGRAWAAPTSFGFLDAVETVPLTDSEYLLTAHHLPLAIEIDGSEARVVAVTAPSCLRHPLVDGEGRWRRAYVPLALRALPFSYEPGRAGTPEPGRLWAAEGAGWAAAGAGHPVLNPDGALSAPTAEMFRTLARATEGAARLAAAADQLRLADLLAPLRGQRGPLKAELLLLDPGRLSACSAVRGSILIRDGFLPMQLVFALQFSHKLLAPGIEAGTASPETGGELETVSLALPSDGLGHLNFAVDESDLVPADFFDLGQAVAAS